MAALVIILCNNDAPPRGIAGEFRLWGGVPGQAMVSQMFQFWMDILIDRETRRLRAGWRLLIFLTLLATPWLLALPRRSGTAPPAATAATAAFEVGWPLILSYLPLVGWVLLVSWICLIWLEGRGPGTLGLGLGDGWWRDLGRGLLIGLGMVTATAAIQLLGGGSRITANPYWSQGVSGAAAQSALEHSLTETGLTILLLLLAALYEELLYRGYAFQTLVRATHPALPVLLLSLLFGLGHWGNPNRTLFSTVNTILAGIWLSLAYLKSGNLWYPTGLHLGWNLALGPIFGIPVSGQMIPAHPLLITAGNQPVWLTGGEYGSEGGAAASIIIIMTILISWGRGDRRQGSALKCP